MDEATRKEFLERIKRDVSALTENDRDVVKHIVPAVLKLAADPRTGPLTLLTTKERWSGSASTMTRKSLRNCATRCWGCFWIR